MGRGASLISGYGWVLDHFEGDYAGNLAGLVDAEGDDLDSEALNAKLQELDLDALVELFGYEYRAMALLWRPSVHESYDWEHDGSAHAPKATQQAQWRRELLQVLDALGWEDADLGEPTWLLLVTYG